MKSNFSFQISNISGYLIILFMLWHCGKENIYPSSGSLSNSQIPLSKGSWWKYTITSPDIKMLDTLKIEIIDTQKGATNNYLAAIFYNEKIIDTASIFKNDVVFQFTSLNKVDSYFSDFKLFLPLQKGKSWQNENKLDSSTVIDTNVLYSLNRFNYEVFSVKRFYNKPNNYLTQFYRISKDIGIITLKDDRKIDEEYKTKYYWLLDYKLK